MSTYREGTTPGWADEPWVPEPTPPAVTLEEHVARAIFGAAGYRYAWDDGLTDESKASYCAQARAAIAAASSSIRESERAACEAIARDVSRGWGSDAAHAIADAIAARKCKRRGEMNRLLAALFLAAVATCAFFVWTAPSEQDLLWKCRLIDDSAAPLGALRALCRSYEIKHGVQK